MRFLAPLISLALTTCSLAQDVAHHQLKSATSAQEIPSLAGGKGAGITLASASLPPNSDEGELRTVTESDAILPPTPEPAYRLDQAAHHRTSEFPARYHRAWVLLTATQHGSAVFDAWSTRQAMASGHAYERDVLVRPFANSAAIYPALQILPLGLDFLSRRMLHSSHSFSRKTWWVPQAVATAGFVWCGARNLRVAQ